MEIQWSLVLFTVFSGAGGWMLLCICLSDFLGKFKKSAPIATVVACVLLAVGGLMSVTHLSHPERILNALQHPTSGIFIEAALIGISAAFGVVYFILFVRKSNTVARRVVAVLAAFFGVALAFMAGHSYMMEARESWNTYLLPLGYMLTAIPTGVAFYLIVAKLRKDDEDDIKAYSKFLLGIGGIIGAVGAAAYGAVTGGEAAVLYIWVLAVCVGGLLPAVFGFIASQKPKLALPLFIAAAVCAIVGSTAYRCYMWLSASTVENFFEETI